MVKVILWEYLDNMKKEDDGKAGILSNTARGGLPQSASSFTCPTCECPKRDYAMCAILCPFEWFRECYPILFDGYMVFHHTINFPVASFSHLLFFSPK